VKTKYSPIFCFLGRPKVRNTGKGNIKMLRSVAILRPAFRNHIGVFGRQLPLIDLFQKNDIGLQANATLQVAHTPQAVMTPR
jgi:hypothetical protein